MELKLGKVKAGLASSQVQFKNLKRIDFAIPDSEPTPSPPTPPANNPRLFFAEYYALSTYLGDMGKSQVIGNYPLLPGEEQEFYLMSKRISETENEITSSVSETNDKKVVENLNNSIKEDNAASHSGEQYDYRMNASFKGDASWSPWGGDVSADLDVRGASNSVRDEFKNSVSSSVDKQIANTDEFRRQRMSTSSESTKTSSEEVSVTKRKIKNADQNKTANYVFYQLSQESISILSLVDIKVGFCDGDPSHNRLLPLSRLDSLLQEVLARPEDRDRVRKVMLGELHTIFDHQGQPRNVLKQQALINDDSTSDHAYWQFDTSLTSRYILHDSAGTVRREIVVPGVIVKIDRRVLPTTNVAVSTLYEG